MCKEQRYCQATFSKQDAGGNEENRISTVARPGLWESGKLFRELESCLDPALGLLRQPPLVRACSGLPTPRCLFLPLPLFPTASPFLLAQGFCLLVAFASSSFLLPYSHESSRPLQPQSFSLLLFMFLSFGSHSQLILREQYRSQLIQNEELIGVEVTDQATK